MNGYAIFFFVCFLLKPQLYIGYKW